MQPRRASRTTVVRRVLLVLAVLVVAGWTLAGPAFAQQVPDGGMFEPAPEIAPAEPRGVPDINVSVNGDEDEGLSQTVTLVLLLTLGSLAPGMLLVMTTFTRFIVVLGLAKNALGLQTVPPAQVLVALAIFLSWFVMAPVITEVHSQAVQPLLDGEISQSEAFETGFEPIRTFMLAQTRESDLAMFTDFAGRERPATIEDVPASTLVPAFVISELRTAFIIGFIIFIPFLIIDLVVAAVIMSMGMVMLPPVFISLPIKLLLFVLVDGWVLIAGSLVNSVATVT